MTTHKIDMSNIMQIKGTVSAAERKVEYLMTFGLCVDQAVLLKRGVKFDINKNMADSLATVGLATIEGKPSVTKIKRVLKIEDIIEPSTETQEAN